MNNTIISFRTTKLESKLKKEILQNIHNWRYITRHHLSVLSGSHPFLISRVVDQLRKEGLIVDLGKAKVDPKSVFVGVWLAPTKAKIPLGIKGKKLDLIKKTEIAYGVKTSTGRIIPFHYAFVSSFTTLICQAIDQDLIPISEFQLREIQGWYSTKPLQHLPQTYRTMVPDAMIVGPNRDFHIRIEAQLSHKKTIKYYAQMLNLIQDNYPILFVCYDEVGVNYYKTMFKDIKKIFVLKWNDKEALQHSLQSILKRNEKPCRKDEKL